MKLKPIHIRTTDPTAGVVCAELERLGYRCTFGARPPSEAKYVVEPSRLALPDADAVIRLASMAKAEPSGFLQTQAATCRVVNKAIPPSKAPGPSGASAGASAASVGPKPSLPAAVRPVYHRTGLRPTIVHIVPWDLTMGGGQRLTDEWCVAEAGRWNIHIITASPVPPLWSFSGAIVHVCLDSKSQLAVLEGLDPDVVVLHNSDHPRAKAVRPGERIVVYLHGEQVGRHKAPEVGELMAALANFPQKDFDASWKKIPIFVHRLGVDLRQYTLRRPPKRERLICGVVGRLSPEKVPWSFIEALQEWEPGSWEIRFVGKGIPNDYQPRIYAALKRLPWVSFCPDVPPSQMPRVYADLDALLIPSVTDTGSYACAEAMACGVPVVARKVGGLPFTSGGHAILRATDEELLDALTDLTDYERSAGMSRSNRNWAEMALDREEQLELHTAVYASAAKPKLSVVMAAYNTDPAFIRECWASFLAQTVVAWELVLVDDGSDRKDTVLELEDIAKDPRVRLFKRLHSGISVSLNFALSQTRCPIVANMDSDDVMVPVRFERQLTCLLDHPEVAYLGGQIDNIGQDGKTSHPLVVTKEVARTSNWFFNHPTVMYRKAAVLECGGYSPDVDRGQDFEMQLRLILSGHVGHNLSDVLVHYRRHPGQVSHKLLVGGGFKELAVELRHHADLRLKGGLSKVFDEVYTEGKWGAVMSSGPGSSDEATDTLRDWLQALLVELKVESVLDVGCGRSAWMREAVPPSVHRYLGLDVAPVVTAANLALQAKEGWEFRTHDMAQAPVNESFHLAICRDVMTHLPTQLAFALAQNVSKSTKYLLATNWSAATENRDIQAGGWRQINLQRAPFGFGPPLRVFLEKRIGLAPDGKTLALFKLRS